MSPSLSLSTGACGFHQLFRDNVACVSQLQGEIVMAPSGQSDAFYDVCDCDVYMCEYSCNMLEDSVCLLCTAVSPKGLPKL